MADKLTARSVATQKTVGYHLDGKGLCLNVTASGTKSWVLRFQLNGKSREMGLGPFPEIGLARARELRDAMREQVKAGKDPIALRDAERQVAQAAVSKKTTFADCVTRFLAAKQSEWSNAKHAAQWRATLETYANPLIGTLPVDEVTTDHVLQVLTPLWNDKTETAVRLRGRIERVLAYAKTIGLRVGQNPATWRGHLSEALPKPSKIATVQHFPALPYRDIQPFMRALRESEGIAARALELLIFTASRTNEVLHAKWEEIDLGAKLWIIPGERMKMRKTHRVPLTAPALTLLKRLHATQTSAFVFPSPRDREARPQALSNMAMLKQLERMGRTDITVHGFRSTFRDWAAEQTSYPREIVEGCLAHDTRTETEAAYQRSDLLKKRAKVLDMWAKHCETAPQVAANVTPIRRAK